MTDRASPQEPVAVAPVCDHHYATRLRGGDPITVRICTLCGTPDWDDLADQAADLYRKGREASEAAAKDARKSRRMADQVNLDAHRRILDAGVETLQKRLRLAHQARLAKVRQLDDIRHALIETGLIEEDDPYGHADLADAIRQVHDGDPQSKRCPSCEHRLDIHADDGCWHTVTKGRSGKDAVCSCRVSRQEAQEALAEPDPDCPLRSREEHHDAHYLDGETRCPGWGEDDGTRPEPPPEEPAGHGSPCERLPDGTCAHPHGAAKGLRGLLEHVGIDTTGRDVTVQEPPRALPASPQWSPGDGHKRCPFTRNTAGGPVRCIFRDGHPPHGHWLPGEQCCVCGSTAVVYWNYRDLPFCGPCADGDTPTAEEVARLRAELTELRRDNGDHSDAADDAHARITALETTLSEVLATFTHKTHPGRACLQSDHVPVGTVERWETVLHGAPEPDTAPLCGCGHRKSRHGEDPVMCRDCPPGRGPMSLAEHLYQPAQED